MPKKSDSDKPVAAELPFEDALERLEELVRDMESDQIPLDDLIGKYELGTDLYRVCAKRLDEAQGRIEIIRKKRNGDHVLETFDDGSDIPDADDSGDSEKNGELF